MKVLTAALTSLPVCLCLAMAQEATTPPGTGGQHEPGREQTFYGILVDAKCTTVGAGTMSGSGSGSMARTSASSTSDQGSMMDRGTPAQSERTWNSTDPNTTGTADRSGTGNGTRSTGDATATRGSNARPTGDTGASTSRDVNRGGDSDMNRTTTAGIGADTQSTNNKARNSIGDTASSQAGQGSNSWDRSCFISPSSSSYILQLQDGRKVRLDNAGNRRVTDQLKSASRVSKSNKIFRVKVTGTMDGETLHVNDLKM